MRGYNKVILAGNLGADPEIRYTNSGTPVATFRLATNEKRGENTYTEWHRIVAYGKLAEIIGEYLSKGKPVLIEGRLHNRSWDDRDGKTHYVTEVIAQQMSMLGNGGSRQEEPEQLEEHGGQEYPDDIPF